MMRMLTPALRSGSSQRARTAPVFARKGKDGQRPDAEADRRLHHALERKHPLAMPFRTRQKPRSRPAAIAVHDDRNVSGQVRKVGHDGCTEKIEAAESLAKAPRLACDGLQADPCICRSRKNAFPNLMPRLPRINLSVLDFQTFPSTFPSMSIPQIQSEAIAYALSTYTLPSASEVKSYASNRKLPVKATGVRTRYSL